MPRSHSGFRLIFFTNLFQKYLLPAFEDQFIVDMTADKLISQIPHGKSKNIPGDCLSKVATSCPKDKVSKTCIFTSIRAAEIEKKMVRELPLKK